MMLKKLRKQHKKALSAKELTKFISANSYAIVLYQHDNCPFAAMVTDAIFQTVIPVIVVDPEIVKIDIIPKTLPYVVMLHQGNIECDATGMTEVMTFFKNANDKLQPPPAETDINQMLV